MTQYVDLRSDTVTRPTPKMRAAMAAADVGDDVYGEDPTLNRLQEEAARRLGKEAALFVPSGTMGNSVCVKVHTRPGEEAVMEATAHIYMFENGNMAAFSGVLPRLVPGDHGVLDPDRVRAAIRPPAYYIARPTLLCLENTHNLGGGVCTPVPRIRELCAVAREHGMATHLDGARIFNAAVALGVDASEIAAPFDSVQFCLSKGLSAPVGSLVVGTKEFVEKARTIRKMLGGGMRQAGILAAAGLVAFDEILPTLKDDHRRARHLAERLESHPDFVVELEWVQTNIVMAAVKAPKTPASVCAALKERGVLASPGGGPNVRFVLHHDIDDAALERALTALEQPL